MLENCYNKVLGFIRNELCFLDLSKFHPAKALAYSFLRIVYIIFHGVVRNNCAHSASALTFITLLYIVPFLALLFSVAKGYNAQELLQESLHKYTETFPTQVQLVIQQIFDLVNRTDFTALGVIGFLILFGAILKSLSTIEEIFNKIWGVKVPRTLLNKAGNYLLILFLVPLLITVSSTMIATVLSDYVSPLLATILGKFYIYYEFVIAFSGILGVISAFTLMYLFLPNTKVRFGAAFIGGLIAGIIWYGIQWIYIRLQIGVTTYNAIYGVFAALPIFLIWLYINWVVVLFGAEVSFSVQNYRTYIMESVIDSINCNTKFKLACLVLDDICQYCRNNDHPWSLQVFQKKNKVPVHLLNGIVFKLIQEGIIVKKSNHGYIPSKDPSTITMAKAYVAILGKFDKRLPSVLNFDNDISVLKRLENEEAKFLESLSRKPFIQS